MIVKLRLHKKYDYDLMLLICGKKIKVATAVKKALDACIKGEQWCENFVIKDISLDDLPQEKECSINIVEKEYVDFLNHIENIPKNAILKSLLRKYYQCDLSYLFLQKESVCSEPDSLVKVRKSNKNKPVQDSLEKENISKKLKPINENQKPAVNLSAKNQNLQNSQIDTVKDIPQPIPQINENEFDLFGCLNDMIENY